MEHFHYKGGCGIRGIIWILRYLKGLAWATDNGFGLLVTSKTQLSLWQSSLSINVDTAELSACQKCLQIDIHM